jgi:hypothetical protein
MAYGLAIPGPQNTERKNHSQANTFSCEIHITDIYLSVSCKTGMIEINTNMNSCNNKKINWEVASLLVVQTCDGYQAMYLCSSTMRMYISLAFIEKKTWA